MATPSEWVDAIIERITNLLPHLPNPLGSSNDLLLKESINSIINLSQHEFAAVNNGLLSLIQKLNKEYPPTMADAAVRESYCILLNCLASCLAKRAESPLGNDDLNSLGHHFFQRITQLCLLSGPETEEISKSACLVLYRLSGLHFHGIFNSIILRVTSVNRISLSDSSSTYNGEQCVIQLIPHLNLNAPRLQQILQVIVTSFKDLKKHKQLFVTIPEILHKSIWNFMREYPTDFNEVLKSQYPSLARSAEKLFSLCEEYSDTVKKKSQIWPLQNTLLLLCPHIMENIAFSDNDKSSPRHKAQKNFLSSVMKGFFNKQLCEAAVVCATDMFTACTYVSDRSSQIFRYFITQMQGNLQNVLFSTSSPFLHQPSSIAAGIPTFSDIDLMVCCLVAQFRLNHRNTHTFNICLNKDSPLVFKLAFIRALHTLIEEKRAMPWWPVSRVIYLYAPEIRNIFQVIHYNNYYRHIHHLHVLHIGGIMYIRVSEY
jgi:neurofibromin 1